MSPDEYQQIRRDAEAEIARDRATVLPKLAAHKGLPPDFPDRAFLEVLGVFAPRAYLPDTPENRRALAERKPTFGYDTISGLSVALRAYQDHPWIAPEDLHALADGNTVGWHSRVPWNRLAHCRCMSDAPAGRPEQRLYTVTVSRSELITFEVLADSPEDAEARYLPDGEETGSKTLGLEVLSVEPTADDGT
ncbi:hypothetical protein GTY75_09105 [Streptomyces sp. SID8381]|uniref:hypothetical protein n=1 Tax=unclassified Streptomyces TaxID=2593676 RepID=UPI00035E5E1E|nr:MULTISPECIES: hypothetical protein [unclassified Streptomyces]MYX26824.1 hypothetical protein [Streptomyces sp. SID8381]